uniref:Legume lectin domain-containing protein n=1 Tax=Oryza punctata TaxID=4537 RepID=A0A0E0KM47_ORYPU
MMLVVLALLGVVTAVAAAGDVVSYSYPAFNATTTRDDSLVAATNSSILTTARLLFDPDFLHDFNVSEGFLLLSDTIDVWLDGVGSAGAPVREASFNTTFTVASPDHPVAFVILLDRYPPLYDRSGLRGNNVSSAADADDGNATNSLVAVEVGTVKSYARESPDVGLNVTVTPNRTAPSGSTVWIQYDAMEHHLSVHVAAAGEPRPSKALLDVPLYLAGGRTTQTALVGFFATTIRDIIVGVRGWELTVERLRGDDGAGKKSTSWLVILLAVVGSVAAVAAMVSVLVCRFVLKRPHMEPKQ